MSLGKTPVQHAFSPDLKTSVRRDLTTTVDNVSGPNNSNKGDVPSSIKPDTFVVQFQKNAREGWNRVAQ